MRFIRNLFVLVVLFLANEVSSDCRLQDMSSIIGGSDYTVKDVRATAIVAGGVNILFVTSSFRKHTDAIDKVLMFLFDYSLCQALFLTEVTNINGGVLDHQVKDTKVTLLAYNTVGATKSEFILITDVRPDANNNLFIDVIDSFVSVPSSVQNFVGLVSATDPVKFDERMVLVAQKDVVRLYTRSTNQVTTFVSSTRKIVAIDYIGQSEVTVLSLGSGKTQFEYFKSDTLNLGAGASYAYSIQQAHGDNGQAKMVSTGTIQSSLKTLFVVYDHSGSATTLVTVAETKPSLMAPPPPQWAYDTTISQYQFDTWLNVFYVGFEPMLNTPQIIAVDANNVIYSFSIDEVNSRVDKLKKSAATSHFSMYAASGQLAKLAYIPGFDSFLYGVTSAIKFSGMTYNFVNPVGFVTSLEKNRVSTLIDASTGLFFTKTSPVSTKEYSFSIGSQTVSAVPPSDPKILSLSPPSIPKNQWTDNFSACESYSIDFQSSCYYYMFYSTNTALLNSNPGTPTSKNTCPQSEMFSFAQYPQLTAAEKNIRSTCFPFYSEYTSADIPGTPLSKMLSVDAQNFQIKWNDTASMEVVGNSWVYAAEEKSDDRAIKGFEANAVFESVGVSDTVITVQSNQDWSKTLLTESKWSAHSVKVSCWTALCPAFVHFNPANFTLYTLAAETYGNKVNGTYIYGTELTENSSGKTTRSTITIKMTLATLNSKASLINIDMPFDIWYELNKNRIPYYAPPAPAVAQDETDKSYSAISEVLSASAFEELIEEFGQQATSDLQSWSKEEVLAAYEEARTRMAQPMIPIRAKAELNSVGLLTISFNNPVSFPSYLLKRFTMQEENRVLGSSLFWTSSGFQTDGARDAMPQVAPTKTGGTQTSSLTSTAEGSAPPPPTDSIASTTQESQSTSATKPSDGSPNSGPEAQKTPGTDTRSPSDSNDGGKPGEQQPGEAPANKPGAGAGEPNKGPSAPGAPGGPDGPGGPGAPGGPDGPGGPGAPDGPDGPGGTGGPGAPGQMDQNGKPGQDGQPNGPPNQDMKFLNIDTQPQSDKTQENQQPKEKMCLTTEYKDEQGQCKPLQIYFGTLQSLFKVELVPSDQSADQDEHRQLSLEFTQKLINATANEITIQFNFTDPLAVSPRDSIRIFMDFGKFEKGFTQSNQLVIPCQRQIVQGKASDTVEAVSQASTAATTTAVVGSAILQTVMSGCMAQIWGMINGMQFVIHLPAINADFPSNAFLVVNKVLLVATFDIPYFNMGSVPRLFPLPTDDVILPQSDQQNMKASLEQLGYSSAYTSNNLGSVYIFVVLTMIGLITSVVLMPFSRFACCFRLNDRIKKKLHWNFVIRLVLEGSLEMSFCCYINFKYGVFNRTIFGSWFNYFTTIVLCASLVILPFFIVIFYLKNFDKLEDEEFSEKFGAVYEGLKTNRRSMLIYPVSFILRRASLMVICLVFYEHVTIQISLMIATTMFAACYLLHCQPFDEPLVNNLEVMNECFTLLMISFLFCFTSLVSSVQDQYFIGYFFIGAMCLCIGTHLFFLFKDMIQQLLLHYKRWLFKRKNPHLFPNGMSAKTKIVFGCKSIFPCLSAQQVKKVEPAIVVSVLTPSSSSESEQHSEAGRKIDTIKEESKEESSDNESQNETMRNKVRENNINCGLLLIDKLFENNPGDQLSKDDAEQIAFEIISNGNSTRKNENVLVQIEDEN